MKTLSYLFFFATCIAHASSLEQQLYNASVLGDLSTVKKLLASGVNPNKLGELGGIALHGAASTGNAAIVIELVKAGANVNAKAALDEHGLNGHTPIFHTVNANANRSSPIMQLLLDAVRRSHELGRRLDVEATRLP